MLFNYSTNETICQTKIKVKENAEFRSEFQLSGTRIGILKNTKMACLSQKFNFACSTFL